jgi:hypothetical protein
VMQQEIELHADPRVEKMRDPMAGADDAIRQRPAGFARTRPSVALRGKSKTGKKLEHGRNAAVRCAGAGSGPRNRLLGMLPAARAP